MALFDADARQAVLRALPPAYYQKSFNSVHAELAALKGGFHPDRLEEVIESRTSMLEVMSEMLAAHVLSHYDKFLEGVKSVATFERELQRSVSLIKQARGELQAELAYVDAGYAIITQTAARGRLLEMLDMLSTLDAVRSLPTTIKDASFGRALWLCAQAWKALEALPQAAATLALQATITSQYEATAAALQSSLRAVCGDFQPGLYSNVPGVAADAGRRHQRLLWGRGRRRHAAGRAVCAERQTFRKRAARRVADAAARQHA